VHALRPSAEVLNAAAGSSNERLPSVDLQLQPSAPSTSGVRQSPHNALDRLRRVFTKKIQPSSAENVVRGLGVAAETLLRCVFSRSQAQQIRVYSEVPLLQVQAQLVELGVPREALNAIKVFPIGKLATHGSETAPRVWYDPFANYHKAFQFRDRFARESYPITCTVHGLSDYRLLYDRLLRVLLAETNYTDSFLCSTDACRSALRKLFAQLEEILEARYGVRRRYNGRFDVLPLPIDCTFYSPGDRGLARKTLGIPKSAFVILYVGRLSFLKCDLLPLLTALASSTSQWKGMEWTLCLAGTTERRYIERIHAFAREVGIPPQRLRVFLNVSDEEKVALLRAADVFTSPSDSLQECFGLSVAEAMATGIPQVVADWSGYREVVLDGVTGFTVPTHWAECDEDLGSTASLLGWQFDNVLLSQTVAMDPGKWLSAIIRLATNESLRASFSRESRRRAVERFSMEAVARQHFDLWQELSDLPRPSLPDISQRRQIESISYGTAFDHFPTGMASLDSSVRCSGLSRPIAEAVVRYAPGYLIDTGAFSPALIRQILQIAQDEGPTPLRSLVAAGHGHGCDAFVLRHVMWAVKQGLLEWDEVAPVRTAGPNTC